jgi:hypothetical protein
MDDGSGFFSFDIPEDTNLTLATAAFKVTYLNIEQSYSKTIIINKPKDIVIDFVSESNKFVYEVPNRVYFQAYSDDSRTSFAEFKGAVLKAEYQSPIIYDYWTYGFRKPDPDEEDVIILEDIETMHRGKGYFDFTPYIFRRFYLEIELGDRIVRKNLNLEQNSVYYQEIQFALYNKDKVLENDEDLII